MHNSRRTFIKHTSIALAGAAILPNELLAGYKKSKQLTGVQLYSVRTEMGKQPLETLKQLSAMGYKHVEHAGYSNRKFYTYAPAEFKKILSDLGMKMPSGHSVLAKQHWNEANNDFNDNWKYTIEDAAIAGQQIVISPWLDASLRKNESDFKKFMDVFNKSGELCKKHGMQFGYHNHDFEFSEKIGDTTLYDMIMQNTDPKLVIQQLDIGNMYNGGAKAEDIINKYPGRFLSMHVKDEIKPATPSANANEHYESTILGKGVINVKEVIDLAKKRGGTKHFIIEQESYQGMAPIDSVKEDLAIMKKWGY